MNSILVSGTRARSMATGLGLGCLLLGVLACGGNGGPPAATAAVPAVPALAAPASGTAGFPVTASVKTPSTFLTYSWTIAPGTFRGGSDTASGTTVQFTPAAPGSFTLTCVATKGNAISSQPATATVTVVPPSNAGGSFQPAGTLLQARQGLAAAVLANGSVLVMGGSAIAGGPGLASTEIYDPAAKTATAGTAMNIGRVGHAVVQLPGSTTQFLVTGGAGPVAMPPGPAEEIYDSTGNAFTRTGAMATGRAGHTATAIASPPGVLVAGGVTTGSVPAGTAELFDPTGHTFAAAGAVNLAPGHSATLLADGKVLLVSHTVSGGVWQPFATVYDPATGTFTATANQPGAAREGHQALRLANPAKVLILGGEGGSGPLASAEWYDPATRTFSPVANAMASPRRDFGAAVVPANGKVLLVGGTADGSTATATAELFDPQAGTFTPTGALGTPRRGLTVFTLPSGRILVLGGSNGTQGPVAAVEAF